jgi:2-polyprenyl-3-methyl-5-hydroxy-6-metoxy-1,4-benzoquinol methylase
LCRSDEALDGTIDHDWMRAADMRIAGGTTEDGVVVGNTYDKYGSRNPIVRKIMGGFNSALSDLIERAAPKSIHEVGCGEGYWVLRWNEQGMVARGCDFSSQVIEIARGNAADRGISPILFETRSIYDLKKGKDNADLIVCCEVLEHLERPDDALRALQQVADKYLIVSVPREPLWRMLNLARGKYISAWGNTPGHIQHWSAASFEGLVSRYFDVVEMKSPLPWTMLLCQPRG